LGRVLRLSDRFQASRRALIVPRTLPAAALGATLGRLAVGSLPGPLDFEALIPPVGVAWVRRVPGSLWLFYRFDDAEVEVLAMTNVEPVRVDRD
jgi:hypothetical protein